MFEKIFYSAIYSVVCIVSYNLTIKLITEYYKKKVKALNIVKTKEQLFKENKGKLKITFLNNSDKTLIFCKKSIEHIEWFLTKYLDYELENENYNDEGYIIYETDKDYYIIKSLLITVQYKFVISYPNIETETETETIIEKNIKLKELRCLAISWACEKEIIDLIDAKIENNSILFNDKLSLIMNFPLECRMCSQGFTLKENKHNSCQFHSGSLNMSINKYHCCNKSPDEEKCKSGMHVPSQHSIHNMKILMNEF